MSDLRIYATSEELFQNAATEFARQAREAVGTRGMFSVALSGGSTPRGLYAQLAADEKLRAQVPWDKTHFFWGDERHVPPDHPDSNYRMAHEALLSKVPVPPANVHRIKSELSDAVQAAASYEQELRMFFRLSAEQWPRFDLIYLGLGPDAHTASLFPDTAALHETQRLVVANWVAKLNTQRITLTAPAINYAACVTFLVIGPDKAAPLQAVLQGPSDPDRWPAQLIRPQAGRLVWLLDRAAATNLASPASSASAFAPL